MALLTLQQYQDFLGGTPPGSDAQYTMMIAECIDAVIKYCNNGTLEQSDYTVVLPAPARPVLYLPHFPILASSLVLSLNLNANGDISRFTSQDILTPYSSYVLQTGPNDNTYSYSGRVDSMYGPFGAGFWVRPIYSLSTRLQPNPGCMLASYTAGWPTVPASLQAAICLLVSKLYWMRQRGVLSNSESWNGESYSITAPATLLSDPTIRNLLRPFTRGTFIGGYTGSL